jgi:hypothetical protein
MASPSAEAKADPMAGGNEAWATGQSRLDGLACGMMPSFGLFGDQEHSRMMRASSSGIMGGSGSG